MSGKASYSYEEEIDGDGSYRKIETNYEHDEYGNIVMRREVQDSYDASTGEESADIVTENTYVYKYDSQGNIVSKDSYMDGNYVDGAIYTYTYDAYGNVSEIIRDSEVSGKSVIVYEYDAMGNMLTEAEYNEEGRCSFNNYVYAEYALEDGIFAPTGRTSGSQEAILPSPTYDGSLDGSSSEDMDSEQGGLELLLADENDIGESVDIQRVQKNVVSFINNEVEGMIMAEEEFSDDSSALLALDAGEIDGVLLCDVDVRLLDEGYSIVLPPMEWFGEDGSFASVVTRDMDFCWQIMDALFNGGYYKPESVIGSYVYTLKAVEPVGGFIAYQSDSSIVPSKLYLSYLDYWGETKGGVWSFYDKEGTVYTNN